jgi:hypothetical protein
MTLTGKTLRGTRRRRVKIAPELSTQSVDICVDALPNCPSSRLKRGGFAVCSKLDREAGPPASKK